MNKAVLGTIYGILVSISMLLILSFLASIIIYYSSLPQQVLNIAAIVINIFSLFAGGLISGKKAGSRGLFQGAIVGIIVLLLMVLFGGISDGFALRASYCLLAAIIGGIFGIK